jgi:hypothetical protein
MNGIKMFLLIVALFVVCAAYPVLYYQTVEEISITIKDKDREPGEGGRYLVFTEGEVLVNTDDSVLILWRKYNSSDVQGMLDIGGTYTVSVVGWRIPFFSMYRNILKVEE